MCKYPGGQVAEFANFRGLFSGVLSPSVHTSGHQKDLYVDIVAMIGLIHNCSERSNTTEYSFIDSSSSLP